MKVTNHLSSSASCFDRITKKRKQGHWEAVKIATESAFPVQFHAKNSVH